MQQQTIRENQGDIVSFGKELGTLKNGYEAILKRITIPSTEIVALTQTIDVHIELLKKPPSQKVIHEHHVPKLLYVTVALFCICICLGMGWF